MRRWPIVNRRQRALEALVYGMILIATLTVGRQLWTTDLGLDTVASDDRLLVTAVDPGGAADRAGVVVGDVIVDQPGLAIINSAFTERELFESNAALGRAMASGHVNVRIVRQGRPLDVDVVPDPAPRVPAALRQLRRIASDLPAAFAFLGVAAWLLRARTRNGADERARRTLAASFALLGPAWTIEWPAPGWPSWLYPLASLLDVWTAGAGVLLLLHFAWSYPTRSALVDRRGLRWAIALAGLPCAAFSSANTLYLVDAPAKLHGNAAVILFDSMLAVAIVAGLAWQRARAKDVIARRQASWLVGSVAVGLFVPILVLLVPKHVFGIATPMLDTVLFPFPLLIPVAFAAVVARYRLFALDGLASRVAPHVIAVVTSLLVCVLITLGLQAAFEWRSGTPSDAARWLGVLAAIVIVAPVRRLLHGSIDRAFGRDRDAFVRQCSELATKLSGAEDARAIEEAVQVSLDAKIARLLTLDDALEASAADAVRAALAQTGTARVLDLRDANAVDVLHAAGFEMLVLVPSSEPTAPPAHVLAFTLPRPAERLAHTEADALALVGRVIGAALAQASARTALVSEMRRAEDERRHIAMELHDGLGAALAAASLMTRNLRAASDAKAGTTLDALDATLREGLGDLRTSLWSLDADHASWDSLITRVRRHTRDMCEAANVALVFDACGGPPCELSASARLAILRVIQQSVSNALEHGAPREIGIRVEVTAGMLSVVVSDDGVGIAADVAPGRGLRNMARRIEALRGEFRFGPREPRGTTISVRLPIAAPSSVLVQLDQA